MAKIDFHSVVLPEGIVLGTSKFEDETFSNFCQLCGEEIELYGTGDDLADTKATNAAYLHHIYTQHPTDWAKFCKNMTLDRAGIEAAFAQAKPATQPEGYADEQPAQTPEPVAEVKVKKARKPRTPKAPKALEAEQPQAMTLEESFARSDALLEMVAKLLDQEIELTERMSQAESKHQAWKDHEEALDKKAVQIYQAYKSIEVAYDLKAARLVKDQALGPNFWSKADDKAAMAKLNAWKAAMIEMQNDPLWMRGAAKHEAILNERKALDASLNSQALTSKQDMQARLTTAIRAEQDKWNAIFGELVSGERRVFGKGGLHQTIHTDIQIETNQPIGSYINSFKGKGERPDSQVIWEMTVEAATSRLERYGFFAERPISIHGKVMVRVGDELKEVEHSEDGIVRLDLTGMAEKLAGIARQLSAEQHKVAKKLGVSPRDVAIDTLYTGLLPERYDPLSSVVKGQKARVVAKSTSDEVDPTMLTLRPDGEVNMPSNARRSNQFEVQPKSKNRAVKAVNSL